jgi:hypothetical protein
MKNMEEAQIKFFSHSPHSTDDLLSGHTQFLINLLSLMIPKISMKCYSYRRSIKSIALCQGYSTEVSCKLLN